MDLSNLYTNEINQLEYCIVAEKTYLPAESVKVRIPKLNVDTSKMTVQAQESILINDDECKPNVVNPIKLLDIIIVKTFSCLELSKSVIRTKEECGCYVSNHELVKICHGDRDTFIDGHIKEAYIPEGAQMIVCFMNNNINDVYLTNFI